MLGRFSQERLKASIGSLYALLFLGSEAVGLILLTKFLVNGHSADVAGVIAMQLYVVGLINVAIVSLVVVSIRSVATFCNESSKSDVAHNPVLHELVGLQIKVFFFLALGLSTGMFFIVAGPWSVTPNLALSSSFFSLGLLIRGAGLVATSHRVGHGEIGADKFFQFVFSIVFFCVSCGLVYFFNADSTGIAAIYLAVALTLTGYQIRHGWRKREISFSMNKYLTTWRNVSNFEAQYLKFVLMSMGGFLTMNGDVFIVSTLWGTSSLAHYSIAAKIGVGIFSIAVVYPSMRIQPIALAFSHGNRERARRLWIECLVVALITGFLFSTASLLIYPYLTSWIFPGKPIVPTVLFMGICINALITSFTGANGWPIIASGKHDLLMPTWLNGLLLVVLGFTGAYWFGIPGLLVSVGCAHAVSSVLHFRIAKRLFAVNV